ncbi:hypothetical protein RAH57_13955 [Chryseobacterium sp. CKR4-1]|uniref:hypothetical protein n=1 Tax=Chryseobacterium sp. CKR4-1 TaxID=3068896 RepID=UPI002796561F|nr:hypothetical protein [Chryseobacterium sp. CKR4-1]MDQ1805097.1 hypothetical protein [Chryseobacterium sp. CKR4-1]
MVRKESTNLSVIFCLVGSLFYGQVGVNNTNPKATLDVTGEPTKKTVSDGLIAPRITGSELKNKDDMYTVEQNGTIIYVTEELDGSSTTARTRNVLRKGYYNFDSSKGSDGEWVRMFDNAPIVFAGANGVNAHSGAAVTVSAANNNTGGATLLTRTFTVTERALVTFSVSVPVSEILNANGSNLTDGASKNYGFNLILNGGSFNNYLFTRQGAAFSNTGNFYATGIYQVNSSRSVVLAPGSYTVNLQVFVFARDSTGIRASFGGPAIDTVLDIIGYSML